jgi:hypothetical protein
MSLHGSDPDRDMFVRIGLGVVVSTLALTASFVGLMALLTGDAVGLGVVLLELRDRPGRLVLGGATGLSIGVLVLVTLAGEGFVYAAREPTEIVASTLVFYFLAAGLIATGLGYWGARHWREVANVRRI